jgi:hypothetical protein
VADREVLKQDIFGALDNVVHLTDQRSKVIISSLENIIYNIAQLDFASWSQYAIQQVGQRLQSNDERYQTSALRALKSIFSAFEFEIKAEREPLHQLIDVFFPVLEGLLGNEQLQNSTNYMPMMTLIAKIFFMSIQVSIPASADPSFCRSKSLPTCSSRERWPPGFPFSARFSRPSWAPNSRRTQRRGKK